MQQINLYQSEFKPKTVVLTAFQMLLITGFVLFLMIVISLISKSSLSKHESNLSKNQQSYQSNQKKLVTLQQRVNQYADQTTLATQLTTLEQKLNEQQAILNHLNKDSLGHSKGFSAVLTGLSQQHLKNVWLTEFSLLQGGTAITLYGQSTESKLIPEYIDSLAQSEYFKGMQFSVFEMQYPEGSTGFYDFKLNSQTTTAGKP